MVVASFFEQANLFPNISALGLSSETVGMGTGGLMLGKLQRKTIHELLENGEELDANHLVHGAPLKVAPDSTGTLIATRSGILRQIVNLQNISIRF